MLRDFFLCERKPSLKLWNFLVCKNKYLKNLWKLVLVNYIFFWFCKNQPSPEHQNYPPWGFCRFDQFEFKVNFSSINFGNKHTNFPQAISRRSHRACSIIKSVFRNFAKLTGKHLCQSFFFNKVAGLMVRVSFLIKLQASWLQLYSKRTSGTVAFLWIFWNL